MHGEPGSTLTDNEQQLQSNYSQGPSNLSENNKDAVNSTTPRTVPDPNEMMQHLTGRRKSATSPETVYSTRRLSLTDELPKVVTQEEFQIPASSYQPPAPKYPLPKTKVPIEKRTFLFDVDNTLYHENHGIHNLMSDRIIDYFQKMGMNMDDAKVLSLRYYKDYGLAIRGLIKHHQVNPVDYDKYVDGGLPLEDILKPDPFLRNMIEKLKTQKWVFTNANVNHARRVLTILELCDLFPGMTYCNYSAPNFRCKPEKEFYAIAAKDSGALEPGSIYLVDDSPGNCIQAREMGWTAIHVTKDPESSTAGHFALRSVKDLPLVLPDLWR